MKSIGLSVGIVALLGATAAVAAPRATGDARIAQIVAGRSMGAPVSCINQRDIRSTELVDGVGVVYFANNGTLYINRPEGLKFIAGFDDFMVTNTYSPQLCRIDIVRLIDRASRISTGSFALGDFVPYSRRAKGTPAG